MIRWTLALPLFAITAAQTGAEEIASDPQSPHQVPRAIETFQPPRGIERKPPRYPTQYQRTNREGWVELSFMVDPQGIPYDVAIIESSGDQKFETATLEAAEGWRYEPARIAGNAIDAGVTLTITFQLQGDGPAGAAPAFTRSYQSLMKAIQNDDRKQADKHLERLRTLDRNLYEEAFFQLVLFNYYTRWGDDQQRYASLVRATFMDHDRAFLPEETMTGTLTSRFGLELKLNRFGSALKTGGELLERGLDNQTRQMVERTLGQINALADSDQPIAIDGVVNANNLFFHTLLRRSFQFEGVKGDIAELRLHCDKDYVGFVYDDLSYSVAESLGNCRLRVIGTPGTTFKLIEI